jgi:toxin ParE1/3/4
MRGMRAGRELEWSAPARGDLLSIWDHVAREASADIADALITRIVTACTRLADWPSSGRARPDVLPDVRSIAVGQYVVFYRPDPNVRLFASFTVAVTSPQR